MTTLYKPVLIESAEQAEALPIGTVATLSEDIGDGVADFYAATKAEDGWERTDSSGPSWMSPAPATGMVGWTALVPIEAEEERARSQINITHLPPPVPQMVPVRLPCLRCGLR
ncbi:MAG: hypothetical protein ACTH6N_13765 [Brachybacterium tyrofermentans]|uniref:hypothetical protein n=1 Tax=Brachybacterium tyrofermentans TaxID=47848 RepID=UPI0018690761|nr:hypothetical protein [Brachybacterium tyrofermentans]